MKAAVALRVRRVEADDVVAAHRLGGLDDPERQIVVVEHRLAARVFRETVERVLRPLEVRRCRIRELSREHADAAWRAARCIAERRVAAPGGASATSPRASTGKMATFARIAAFVVARSCAWLSTPLSLRPL